LYQHAHANEVLIRLELVSCSKGENKEEIEEKMKRFALDNRSSNNLRRKNSENKIFLDSEL
jgi:hypothetical protein